MNRAFPIFTILPSRIRVTEAVRIAQQAKAGLWLTDRGQVIVAPFGRPGWLRLPITKQENTPCAA